MNLRAKGGYDVGCRRARASAGEATGRRGIQRPGAPRGPACPELLALLPGRRPGVSRRRGATGLVGILPVDKPAGMTSHDVVSVVRHSTGERRVGHAGTLDPLATGLLVVLVGPATRLAPWLSAAEKTYAARVVFGTRTDTDDAEGEVVATADVPADLGRCRLRGRRACCALEREHLQVPPAFSAIKVGGQVAHRAARAGKSLELEPRPIRVLTAALVGIDSGPPLTWDIEVTVSKGTYVRALARDLGQELGTEAHLGALRRTASGTLTSGGCAHAGRIVQEAGPAIDALFVDPGARAGPPCDCPWTSRRSRHVSHGRSLSADDISAPIPPPGEFVSIVHEGSCSPCTSPTRSGCMLRSCYRKDSHERARPRVGVRCAEPWPCRRSRSACSTACTSATRRSSPMRSSAPRDLGRLSRAS